jgi:hypothetical protein
MDEMPDIREVTAGGVLIRRFWYDDGAKVLAIRLDRPGFRLAVQLSADEMRDAVQRLGHPTDVGGVAIPTPVTELWWEYGEGLGDADGRPPLMVYRDDYLYALPPHVVGQALVKVFRERLAEAGR